MGATRTITTGLGLVAALALSACGAQVAGSGQPPVLRIGSTNVSGIGAAMDAARPAAAGGARSGSRTDPYPLHGTLPTGPSSAPVYRYSDARVAEDRVSSLATALGISAGATRHAHGWAVGSTAGTLLVRDGSGQWSFNRAGNQCPAYTVDVDNPDGATSAVGCAVATDVAVPPSDVTPPTPSGVPASCQANPAPDCGANAPAGPATQVGTAPRPCVSGDPQPGVVSCSDPAPTPTPTRAPRPAISDAQALDSAKPVLAALGLGDLAPRVTNAGSYRDVTVDPTVGGLPTQGIITRLSVDATGVLGATGWLGEAVEGPAYPLVTAAQALDRLRRLPVPEIAIACVQGAECPSGILARPVTGATLGLALRWDQTGTVGSEVLVPAWLFHIEGSTEPLAWVAVQDAYLGDPTPDPGVTDPGSGSTASPGDPGASQAPPSAVGPPVSVAPTPVGPTAHHPVAITSVGLGKDGSTLLVTGFGGMCEDFSASAEETSTTVTLSLVGTPNQDANKACPAMAKEVSVSVVLASPWDKRKLVDAATGEVVHLG